MVPTPHHTSLSLLPFNKTLEPLSLWTPNVMCVLHCVCGSMQILTCVHTHEGRPEQDIWGLLLLLFALLP